MMMLHEVALCDDADALSLQVKDCYFTYLVKELHEEKTKTMIIFTHTCRYLHR